MQFAHDYFHRNSPNKDDWWTFNDPIWLVEPGIAKPKREETDQSSQSQVIQQDMLQDSGGCDQSLRVTQLGFPLKRQRTNTVYYEFKPLPEWTRVELPSSPPRFQKINEPYTPLFAEETRKLRKIANPTGEGVPIVEDGTRSETSNKLKIKGASLIDTFSAEQISEHLKSLKLWFGENKSKAEKKQAMAYSKNKDACPLCNVEKLYFEAPYCSLCDVHFKQRSKYFTSFEGDAKYAFCTTCYEKTEGEVIGVDGLRIHKERLYKTEFRMDSEEEWVYCDKCGSCQHQICALFNNKKNIEEEAEYICPKCVTEEIKYGERTPLKESAIPGAKDLPRTKLSDFLERRLSERLNHEREERAQALGKTFDEVPGADGLVLRVVSSVDKILQVKQNFLNVFVDEKYPKEFPYRSKVILLFQKIDGAEVCLFGLFVQEYGSKCPSPNRRSVYISYLDSVKYFRPDVKTSSGEALRSFVYHEIMVGYLDYCKNRGFRRCHIWSCPPSRKQNYLFYCHPEIQKNPKASRLLEWYIEMLRKAANEKIVDGVTNLYDLVFVPHGRDEVTAANLPYFDGDYCPRMAGDVLKNIAAKDRTKPRGRPSNKIYLKSAQNKESKKITITDALLMKELGKSIVNKKEKFIVVNLKSECMHLDTEDEDGSIKSKIFDTRETFLKFCETNHYQFDTLRRAKHSSMMLLYHLHKPNTDSH